MTDVGIAATLTRANLALCKLQLKIHFKNYEQVGLNKNLNKLYSVHQMEPLTVIR